MKIFTKETTIIVPATTINRFTNMVICLGSRKKKNDNNNKTTKNPNQPSKTIPQ